MSMLSAQCDELRELANRMDGLKPQTAAIIRDAADTIWSLRDRAQQAQAENDRLRAARDTWQENDAKLRELVRDIRGDVVRLKNMLTTFDHEPTPSEAAVGMLAIGTLGSIDDRMRKLGIEVDE